MSGRTTFFALLLLAGISLSACGGGARAGDAQTEPPITVIPSTPIPTQSGPPIVRTSLDGNCTITPLAAQIRVEFTVTAFGSTMLTRVELLEDGKQVDDSGPLEQRAYRRVATFDAEPGERHTYRVTAQSQAGPAPSAQTTVVCASEPSPRPGPRAERAQSAGYRAQIEAIRGIRTLTLS